MAMQASLFRLITSEPTAVNKSKSKSKSTQKKNHVKMPDLKPITF